MVDVAAIFPVVLRPHCCYRLLHKIPHHLRRFFKAQHFLGKRGSCVHYSGVRNILSRALYSSAAAATFAAAPAIGILSFETCHLMQPMVHAPQRDATAAVDLLAQNVQPRNQGLSCAERFRWGCSAANHTPTADRKSNGRSNECRLQRPGAALCSLSYLPLGVSPANFIRVRKRNLSSRPTK